MTPRGQFSMARDSGVRPLACHDQGTAARPTRAVGRNRRQVGDDVVRFTAVTAAKTGKPERIIQRDATRAKALGPDLDRLAATSLDKGAS
jgi:hypothetical protein